MLKKFYVLLLVLILVLTGYDAYAKVKNYYRIAEKQRGESNAYVRTRVVQLFGDDGGRCSGFLVKSKKGRIFILTARHCQSHLFNERMIAADSKGSLYSVKVIKVSTVGDVMLLDGFGKTYLELAENNKQFERVHTIAYHNSRGPYREDGDCICFSDALPLYAPLTMPCNTSNKAVLGGTMIMSMKVIPGASGGPILNYKDQIVGIVSYIDYETEYSYSPTLLDIREILKDR